MQVFLTGVPGLNQPSGVKAVGDAPAEHRHPADRARRRASACSPATSQGFPNGRRLTDDVIDITLQAAAGVLGGVQRIALGDGVDRNDVRVPHDVPVPRAPALGQQPVEAQPERAARQLTRHAHDSFSRTTSGLRRDHRRRRGDGGDRQLARHPAQPPAVHRGAADRHARRADDLARRSRAARRGHGGTAARQPDDVGAAVLLADALLRQTRVTGNAGLAVAPSRC